MADWQSALQNFLDSNPDLPEGDELTPAPEEKPKGGRITLCISMEKKGRAGKTATIIDGFPDSMTDEEISSLAAFLKQRLGTGGSARGGEILIQGDRRADLRPLLQSKNFLVKG